jgi:TRAP-type uncharacterized transport system substrate-binding protein
MKDAAHFQGMKFEKYGIPLHPGAEKYYRDKGMMK